MEKRIPIKHKKQYTTLVKPSDLPDIERFRSEKNPNKPKVYTLAPTLAKMKSVPTNTVQNRISETR